MPTAEYNALPVPEIDNPQMLDYANDRSETPESAGPSFAEEAGAAFRQNNLIGSLVSSDTLYQQATSNFYEIDPDFKPYDPENIKGYEDYSDRFTNAFSKRAMDTIKADIDQETKDKKVMAQSGWTGFGLDLTAGLLDPTILLPAGALVDGAKGGYAIGRSALNAALAAGGGAAAQEVGFQLSQQTRTEKDALYNIGGSALLGGILGGGAAGVMSLVEHRAASLAFDAAKAPDFDNETNALHEGVSRFASAGAAAADRETLGDLTIAGKAARATAAATAKLNPLLRTLQSPSLVVRKLAGSLMENPVYLQKNLEGLGDAAAETSMHEFTRGALAQAVEASRAAYVEARKNGLNIPEADFRKEVGRAMRRNDTSGIPGVAQAASAWRSVVFDPLKERAIKTGLLPADVDVKTASSYFTRMWSRERVEANENEFRSIVRSWVDGAVDKAGKAEGRKLDKRLSNLHTEKGELETGILRREETMNARAAAGDLDLGGISEEDVVGLVKRFNNGERPKEPQTLSAWLKGQRGGVFDPNGDLAAAFPDAKRVPGLLRKNRRGTLAPNGGDGLDDIALRAWQEGFFPQHGQQRPSLRDFLDAVAEDARGNRIVRHADVDAARAADDFDQMVEALDRIGVDFNRPHFGTAESLRDIGNTINRVLGDMDKEKIAKLEAKIAEAGERGGLDFVNDEDRAEYINEIVDGIYNKITGRGDGSPLHGFTVSARGPLKERTFNIPDELVEKFLTDDVEEVGGRYARVMAGDTELAERFGTPDMAGQIDEIRREYDELRKAAGNDEKAIKKLNKKERSDVSDISAVRDMLRGTYRPGALSEGWENTLHALGAWNYMRSMGGVFIGSLTDAVRPAMVHGLTAYMRDGIAPMIRGMKAAGMSKQEAKLAGAISEKILGGRMATMAEITDPYARGNKFGRFLNNAAEGFSKMTGLMHWDDFQKTLASRMTQNRILANAEKAARDGFDSLSKREKAYMGYLGIGQQKAEDLGRLFARHGETLDGVKVANSDAWGDDAIGAAARRAYRAAINKDVDSIIVTKGVGDVPLFSKTPIGRALIQFKSFSIASNQRVLLRGLQEGPTRMIGGVVGMATIGAFIYALKQIEAGREISNNPGTWAMEGLDRSGIFALGFEVNNAMEKLTGLGAYRAAGALFPNSDRAEPASRFASRSLLGSQLGPTFELGNDVVSLAASGFSQARKFAGDDKATGFTPGDVGTVRRLTPFASLPYWRWLIDNFVVPEAKEAVQ